MRVGVITHWRSDDNYGQTLQAYALQTVLKGLGHNPYLIRYITDGGIKRRRYVSMASKIKKRLIDRFSRFSKNESFCSHSRKAQSFLKDNIELSSEIYTRSKIQKIPPKADCFITGSDQVWNKLDGSYFLDFVKDNKTLKISYAASFGGHCYKDIEAKYVYSWLKDFNALSVREYDGLKYCKNIGLDGCSIMPDPTILLTREKYELLCNKSIVKKPYILLYILGNKTDFDIESVFEYASKKNLEVVYVASQGQVDKFPKVYPSINEWLSLISSAKYVVTNSFHGTVFSLIFRKPFISIPLSGEASKMNSRIITLLSEFDLCRNISDNINLLDDFCYPPSVEMILNKMKAKGLNFLKANLSNE